MTILKNSEDDLCLNLLLTSICNAGCAWCIANEYMTGKKSYALMTPENSKIVLDMLKKEPVSQVNLLGGEPSLHPEALRIGRQIHNLGISVGFSTNGLWSEEFAEEFGSIDYTFEAEVTYLGESHPNYKSGDIVKLNRTFSKLRRHSTSLGLIIATPDQPYEEHLDIAQEYGFNLRWALLEPTRKSGQVWGYKSKENALALGARAIEIILRANERGISTWADLTVPRCAVPTQHEYLFLGNDNDIQFKCPPFFDISPNLDIWRCLPLAPQLTPKLTDFSSFREAYRFLDQIKSTYKHEGVFSECSDCHNLESICSGGPVIAKQLK